MGTATLHPECVGSITEAVKWRNGTKCLPEDSIIKGTLVEPVELKPKGPSFPPFVNSPGCRTSSERPVWNLTGLRLEQTIWNDYKRGELKFTMGNGANGFTTPVDIWHPDLNVYTDSPHNRSFPLMSEAERGFAGNEVATNIGFDPTTNAVSISQSWTCYEEEHRQDHP